MQFLTENDLKYKSIQKKKKKRKEKPGQNTTERIRDEKLGKEKKILTLVHIL